MNQIIPSILEKSFERLEEVSNKFLKIQNKVNRIEIDICDGEFVKNKTWIPEKSVDPYLPNWEIFNYTGHLMVKNPLKYIEVMANYGFDRVVIHIDSCSEIELEQIFAISKNYEMETYLAYKLENDLGEFKKNIKKYFDHISGMQVMCIDKVGFQKQVFDERSLNIISSLKSEFGEKNICVDGSINPETLEMCKNAGANEFVVGSFLVNSSDIREDFNVLSQSL